MLYGCVAAWHGRTRKGGSNVPGGEVPLACWYDHAPASLLPLPPFLLSLALAAAALFSPTPLALSAASFSPGLILRFLYLRHVQQEGVRLGSGQQGRTMMPHGHTVLLLNARTSRGVTANEHAGIIVSLCCWLLCALLRAAAPHPHLKYTLRGTPCRSSTSRSRLAMKREDASGMLSVPLTMATNVGGRALTCAPARSPRAEHTAASQLARHIRSQGYSTHAYKVAHPDTKQAMSARRTAPLNLPCTPHPHPPAAPTCVMYLTLSSPVAPPVPTRLTARRDTR